MNLTFLFLVNVAPPCDVYSQQHCIIDNKCGWCEALELCIQYDACRNNTQCPGPINSIQTCSNGAMWISIVLLILVVLLILIIPLSAYCSIRKTCQALITCYDCMLDGRDMMLNSCKDCYHKMCYRNELQDYSEIL